MMSQTIFVCGILENAKLGGSVALLGMATVFIVLALLWLAIEIAHVFITMPGKSKKKSAENKNGAVIVEKIEPVVVEEEAPVQDDGEIVAAISAALAEYLDVPQSSFRVVSFKKAANGAHWNK